MMWLVGVQQRTPTTINLGDSYMINHTKIILHCAARSTIHKFPRSNIINRYMVKSQIEGHPDKLISHFTVTGGSATLIGCYWTRIDGRGKSDACYV